MILVFEVDAPPKLTRTGITEYNARLDDLKCRCMSYLWDEVIIKDNPKCPAHHPPQPPQEKT